MKITRKYCSELLEKHGVEGQVSDGSDVIDAKLIKNILLGASSDSRFRVGYDPTPYTDDGDTWDLVGPGVPHGRIYYDSREEAESDRDNLNKILREHFGPNSRKVAYSPDAYTAKCLLDHVCCPVCESNRVELEDYFFKKSACVFRRGCRDCNSEWNDVFALQGYQDLRID